METLVITIIGNSGVSLEVQQLLSRSGYKVFKTELEQDYVAMAAEADIVLEFTPDVFDVKSKVIRDCDKKCHPETVLAVTTTKPWITRLSRETTRPEKLIGINFVKNPVQEKFLAQVVIGLPTSPQTVETCVQFLEKAGITPVRLQESPGFIIDRVIASIINEAALMYSTKVATIEDIDKMVKVCANWPLGPFEFADIIGIDHVVATLEYLYQQLGPKYQPCLLLRKMVDAGWLGRKTGRGFYVYSKSI